MLASPTFDVILSLVLIYALLSIMASILNEILSYYTKDRAVTLRHSIVKLLRDPQNLDYGELFYNHLTIQSIMYSRKRRQWFGLGKRHNVSEKKFLPSYIASSTFADVLIDIITRQARHSQGIIIRRNETNGIQKDNKGRKLFDAVPEPVADSLPAKFRLGVETMHPSAFKDLLIGFSDHAGNDSAKLKAQIEDWFNDYQDRVTGWYQIKQQKKLRFIGLVAAVLLNADTFHIVKILSLDHRLRAQLVTEAEVVANNYSKLHDSLSSDAASLLRTFSANDSVVRHMVDSSIDSGHTWRRPRNFAEILREKDSVYAQLAKILMTNDSLTAALNTKSDQVMQIASSLNLPIGYTWDTAPLSWGKKSPAGEMTTEERLAPGLYNYNKKRNEGGIGIIIAYLGGILLTGFALSVGAPFWFSLLLRLVNVRRTGTRPKNIPKV